MLVRELEGGVVLRVPMTRALMSLLLALAVARVSDLREGLTEFVGCRSLEDLGRMVARVPGRGNEVTADAIRDCRKRIRTKIVQTLEEQSERVGRKLCAPDPIVHPAYGQGYCLAPEGLVIRGLDLDDLLGH